jgi:xylulokinase
MPLVAGVDSSTSACKVEVRDADTGTVVASGRASHPPTRPPRSEQHPGDWWIAFEAAAGDAGLFGPNRPAAISIAGQQHGLVVLDRAGAVLRPAKLWNDTESAPDATHLVDELGAAAWAKATGSVPVASFTITKLAWLRRNEPDVFAQIERVLLPHDWLTHRLTGGFSTDRGDASGTGWWSPADGAYRPDLLALVDPDRDWDAALPQVLGPHDPAGDWDGVVVGPGTGDNMAAAVGLGLAEGQLALSLGTSGTAFCVSPAATADVTGYVAGFADATGRYLPLVCTLNATKVTDAVGRLLSVDAAGLDELALSAPPGAGGLVLVPHLDGERTPNRPDATGTLSGIRADVTPAQLSRAAFEGVIANLLAGADRLPVAADRVILVGGGGRSRAFRQITADLSGLPVAVPSDDELVARGAAVQAASVLTGASIADVQAQWGLDIVAGSEPDARAEAATVRAAYREAAGE